MKALITIIGKLIPNLETNLSRHASTNATTILNAINIIFNKLNKAGFLYTKGFIKICQWLLIAVASSLTACQHIQLARNPIPVTADFNATTTDQSSNSGTHAITVAD